MTGIMICLNSLNGLIQSASNNDKLTGLLFTASRFLFLHVIMFLRAFVPVSTLNLYTSLFHQESASQVLGDLKLYFLWIFQQLLPASLQNNCPLLSPYIPVLYVIRSLRAFVPVSKLVLNTLLFHQVSVSQAL